MLITALESNTIAFDKLRRLLEKVFGQAGSMDREVGDPEVGDPQVAEEEMAGPSGVGAEEQGEDATMAG